MVSLRVVITLCECCLFLAESIAFGMTEPWTTPRVGGLVVWMIGCLMVLCGQFALGRRRK